MKNTTNAKTYLYVIKTPQMDEEERLCYSIKFGFAKDFNDRLKNGYGAYFWNVTTLHVYEGDFTLDDEYAIKQYLAEYALFKTEWFKYRQEVIDFFDKYNTSEKLRAKIDEIPVKKISKKTYHNVDHFLLDYIVETYHKDITGVLEVEEKKVKIRDILREYTGKNQINYLIKEYDGFSLSDFKKYLEDRLTKNSTDRVLKKVEEFNSLKTTRDKLRYLVDYAPSASGDDLGNFLELIPGKYKDYYTVVGPGIISSCSYIESEVKKKWREKLSNEEIEDKVVSEIYKLFRVGQRYTKVDIKESLNNLYQRLGYQKKAKATDLELYYLTKYVKFQDSTGKWVHGFEIIGKR